MYIYTYIHIHVYSCIYMYIPRRLPSRLRWPSAARGRGAWAGEKGEKAKKGDPGLNVSEANGILGEHSIPLPRHHRHGGRVGQRSVVRARGALPKQLPHVRFLLRRHPPAHTGRPPPNARAPTPAARQFAAAPPWHIHTNIYIYVYMYR